MYSVIGVILLGVIIPTFGDPCSTLYKEHGLSARYNETIAHAIHSLTLNELRKFSPDASELNGVPVVNPRLNDPTTNIRVVPHAPLETLGSDFLGETMNTVDMVLNQIGQPTDGLGPNWSPLERLVHKFHMKDLWSKIRSMYDTIEKPEQDLCDCLTDTKNNGIYKAIDWIARHSKTRDRSYLFSLRPVHDGHSTPGNPNPLLNRTIPKLTDAKSWAVWRAGLLHYYDSQALTDAAMYLHCVLN